MNAIRKLIRTDGSEHDLIGPISNGDAAALIAADALDVVPLFHLGRPLHVMLVDDNAWATEVVERENHIELRALTPKKPINARATALYLANCKPGTTHQIAGDVVIVPDDDYA